MFIAIFKKFFFELENANIMILQ